MAREDLLNFLLCKSEDYRASDGLSMTRGGGDFEVIYSPVCERPSIHSGYDVFSVHWSTAKPASHYTQGQPPILKNIENWRNEVRFPVVNRFNWDYVANQAKALDRQNKVSVVTLAIGPFERTTTLCAFEDALVNAISDPEDYADLVMAIANYKIEVIDYLYRYVKPDVINLHDDWGTAQNTFFRPELWRQTIKPVITKMYAAIRDRGMIVGQHSCGHTAPFIGDAVAAGMQVWEAQSVVNDTDTISAEFRGQLRIIARPPATSESISAAVTAGTAPNPSIEEMTMNYQPFSEVPEFLY